MARLKKIDVVSFAVTMAIISAILGFIAGIIAAAFGAATATALPGIVQAGLGLLAIIVFPITWGISGLIGGAIFAFLYNIVSEKVTKGVEIVLE